MFKIDPGPPIDTTQSVGHGTRLARANLLITNHRRAASRFRMSSFCNLPCAICRSANSDAES